MNVVGIRVSDWDKDGTIVKVSNVTFDDGREVPGYDLPPGIEEGKPLPDGWEIATSKAGKPYIKVPKARGGGGGAPAYRNTREGQAYEQERMDRRTALMQAVAWDSPQEPRRLLTVADDFYNWLRSSSTPGVVQVSGEKPAANREPNNGGGSTSGSGEVRKASPGADASSAEPSALGEASADQAGAGGGTKDAPSPSPCKHEHTSPLSPSGRELKDGKLRCLDCGTVIPGGAS